MAKKVVATLKNSDGKGHVKCIKMVKSPKTGAYVFEDEMVTTEEVKDFFAKK